MRLATVVGLVLDQVRKWRDDGFLDRAAFAPRHLHLGNHIVSYSPAECGGAQVGFILLLPKQGRVVDLRAVKNGPTEITAFQYIEIVKSTALIWLIVCDSEDKDPGHAAVKASGGRVCTDF